MKEFCFSALPFIILGLSISLGMVVGEAIGSTIKKGK